MRIAYFDCPSGISGSMILGALLDCGVDINYLKQELKKLQIADYQLSARKVRKKGLLGTYFRVRCKGKTKPRTYADISTIIEMSTLSKFIKNTSLKIFTKLARAESKVHGIPLEKIHFHEVGAVDAIIDIVGTCIAIEKLTIEKIYCSLLPMGKGKIKYHSSYLPNPAPATAELLKGVPIYGTNINAELVTPTGAAIITTLASSFGNFPRIKLESVGYGAGTFRLPIPNLLRVFIGEAEIPTEKDTILQIETNIDDMSPKFYDLAITQIMKSGALDVSIQPIRMKKRREGIKMIILCQPEVREKVLEAIFRNTTTIGTRIFVVSREKLKREIKGKNKISYLGEEVIRIKPE